MGIKYWQLIAIRRYGNTIENNRNIKPEKIIEQFKEAGLDTVVELSPSGEHYIITEVRERKNNGTITYC